MSLSFSWFFSHGHKSVARLYASQLHGRKDKEGGKGGTSNVCSVNRDAFLHPYYLQQVNMFLCQKSCPFVVVVDE